MTRFATKTLLALTGLALTTASAHAATVLIEYDFVDLTGMTIVGDTLTYTGSNVDGTELEITAVASFFGTAYSEVGPTIADFGLAVEGGKKGGSNEHKNLGYDGVNGWHEILTISFNQDVVLNVASEVGSFAMESNTGASEGLQFVSSEGGTDSGVDDVAPHSFSNITTLTAGETLTLTAFNTGGPGEHVTTALAQLNVYTESNPVPEPSSLALLGLGGLLIARRRRNS